MKTAGSASSPNYHYEMVRLHPCRCGIDHSFSFSNLKFLTPQPQTGNRKIQAAILLDVSNSMDGLIEQAGPALEHGDHPRPGLSAPTRAYHKWK